MIIINIMVQDCLTKNDFLWRLFIPHPEFPGSLFPTLIFRAIGNKQFYLDSKQLASGHFIWISEQSAVGNFICIGNSDVAAQDRFPTSKTLQKRSPGPLQNRSQIVQKSLLPGLPLQPTPFATMTGNFLQTYQKHIPKRVSKNRPFLLKTVFQPPKPSENEGPDPPKINQKSPLILEGPKLKNKQTLPHFSSFFDL